MNLMIVDRSGRGHALAATIARTSPDVAVHYVPGCDGIDPAIQCQQSLTVTDGPGLVAYARQHDIDLVIVANAIALAVGVVDHFRDAGIPVVGPDRAAARLESSKVFAKQLFAKHRVPTAEFQWFDEPEAAIAFVQANPEFCVVKADGLCGGNGSFVCGSPEQAEHVIDRLMRRRIFGDAGQRVVVERRLRGRELSYFAVVDPSGWIRLPLAVDYPKADDGNRGPISGGMGALSHHPFETPELMNEIEKVLMSPIHSLIHNEGFHYTGFLYLGVMLTDDGPMLLEINVRMGDPEAEVVLPRLQMCAAEFWGAVTQGRVAGQSLSLSDEYLCDVVATQGPTVAPAADAAASGARMVYPGWPFGAVGAGHVISGLEDVEPEQALVFVGEAKRGVDGRLRSDGGRVVHVVGRGNSQEQAAERAYRQIGRIWFEGMRYRHDIGLMLPWMSFPE